MSYEVQSRVMKECPIKGSKRMLMLVLASHADDNGNCWPGQKLLASECGFTTRGLRKMVAELERIGELKVVEHGVGRGNSTRYFLEKYAAVKEERGCTKEEQHVPRFDFTQKRNGETQKRNVETEKRNGEVVKEEQLVPPNKGITKNHQEPSLFGEQKPDEKPESEKPNQRFKPPTVEQCAEYFRLHGSNDIEGARFFMFYESKDWRVGKVKMKKWTAAAGGWISRNVAQKTNGTSAIEWKPNELQVRLGAIFRRPATSPWSYDEIQMVSSLIVTEPDVALLEKYYSAKIAQDKECRRRDLRGLLANYTPELDRARNFKPHSVF